MGLPKTFRRFFSAFAVLVMAEMAVAAGGVDYGLRFRSNAYAEGAKSYLLLAEGKAIPTRGSVLTLSFDMRNQRTMQFGSVLRMADGSGTSLDLIYYVNDLSQFTLAATCCEQVVEFPATLVTGNDWNPVRIDLDPAACRITVTFAREVRVFEDPLLGKMDAVRMVFGDFERLGAGPKEVAGVDVRNIVVSRAGKPVHSWPLLAHGDGFCLDECGHLPAIASCCDWLADAYSHWREVAVREYPTFVGLDMCGEKLYCVSEEEVDIYDVITQQWRHVPVSGGYPALDVDLHIKCWQDRVYSYNVDRLSWTVFDERTGCWSGAEPFEEDYVHYSSTACVDSLHGRICSFGGYGLYRFADDFSVIPLDGSPARQEHLPALSYRFQPASAFVDGACYIYGGYGSLNGRQGFAVKYYNDLQRVDPDTFEVTTLWSLPQTDEGNLHSENIVWDPEAQCFYSVVANTSFCLERIRTDQPEATVLSTRCPPSEGGIVYRNNLFYCPEDEGLYLTSIQGGLGDPYILTLLRMSWPPMAESDLLQERPASLSAGVWVPSVLLVFLLLAGAAYLLTRRRMKRAEVSWQGGETAELLHPVYDFTRSSVSFLGGFRVYAGDGKDVSASFTPSLRALFVLLVLSTPKGGITSARLERIIWPYKPEATAANNRNVYISRLRGLLEGVGDIRITCKNKIWTVETGEGVLCDYLEVMRLHDLPGSRDNIDRLTELLLRGVLLPDMDQPWAEAYKKDFSAMTVEFISFKLRRKDLSPETALRLADLLLQYDYLNEDAMRAKCRILYQEGKTGLAKSAYDNFCSDYQEGVGVAYPVPLGKIIETNRQA